MGNIEREVAMLRMYAEGFSQPAVADQFGVSASRICQILGSWGIRERDTYARRQHLRSIAKRKRELAKERARKKRDEIVRRMWLADEPNAIIGAAIGMSDSRVGRLAKDLGLPQRARGGWWRDGRNPTSSTWPSPWVDEPAPEPEPPERVPKMTRCHCGNKTIFECLCGRVRCEDHATMTLDGIRCEVCMGEINDAFDVA